MPYIEETNLILSPQLEVVISLFAAVQAMLFHAHFTACVISLKLCFSVGTFCDIKGDSICLVLQGMFFNACFIAYVMSPKLCHSFVGYLEEEAVTDKVLPD